MLVASKMSESLTDLASEASVQLLYLQAIHSTVPVASSLVHQHPSLRLRCKGARQEPTSNCDDTLQECNLIGLGTEQLHSKQMSPCTNRRN